MAKKIKDIDYLISVISNEIEKGKIKLYSALDKQKTLSYWNIGKYINEHLSFYTDENDYGLYLFSKLSQALDVARSTLYLSVQFYKTYSITHAVFNYLTWSHFRILLTVKSPEKRKEYEKILKSKKLTIRDFFLLVKNDSTDLISYDENNLNFVKGIPYIYKMKYRNNMPYLDLGFHIYSDLFLDDIKGFEDKSIIQTSKKRDAYNFKKTNLPISALYTYKAFVIDVIDGDTIHVDADIGFNMRTSQKLRLRGIDSEPLNTKSGLAAKEFVISEFKDLDFIVIKTYHTDIYSRYLADIFYKKAEADISSIINSGSFLNQKLLDNKLAVKWWEY
jgi:micrococcal nuclease